MVDVRSRLCDDPTCGKNVTFGFPGDKATRCKEHMLEGMVNLKTHKKNIKK